MDNKKNTVPETRVTWNRDKYKELIVYIARKAEGYPKFGDVHLNKTLVYSDLRAFARFGEPVTGAKIQRLPFGPASKALLPVRQEMNGVDVLVREPDGASYTPRRTFALREPDLRQFSAKEIALIDEVFEELAGMSATEVSDSSHDFVWRFFDDKEEIPYGMVYFDEHRFSSSEIEAAKSLEAVRA